MKTVVRARVLTFTIESPQPQPKWEAFMEVVTSREEEQGSDW